MATIQQFYRFNTDTVSTLSQAYGSVTATPLISKNIRVSIGTAATIAATNNILDSALLTTLVTGTGNFYIAIQVAGRSTALNATDGARIYVQNESTGIANSQVAYHKLTNNGDSVLIPWQVISTDPDVDAAPNIGASLSVVAGAGKYIDLEITVLYNA